MAGSREDIACSVWKEGRVPSKRPLESLPKCWLDTSVAHKICFRHSRDLTGSWKVDSASAGLVGLLGSSLGSHLAGQTSTLVPGRRFPALHPLLSPRVYGTLWKDISALHSDLLKTLKRQSPIFRRCQGTNYFSFYPAFSKQTVPPKKPKNYMGTELGHFDKFMMKE